MPIIKRTITTTLPVEDAFSYLADFSNATEWDPGTASSVPQDQEAPHVGQRYDLVVTWGSRELPMTYEITALDPNRLLVLEGDGSTTTAVDTMTFAAVDGTTTVVYEADIRLKGLLRLAEPFLKGKFKALGDEAEYGLATALANQATSQG